MPVSSAVGEVLQGVFAAVGRVRPTDKPLHPRGVVQRGTVDRRGSAEHFGVPWLDDPGSDGALVRFSRGAGLPDALPDVLGIALRVDLGERPGDQLFATTGRSVPGRFLLIPRRSANVSPTTYSTLQPYRTPTGPVVLAATPEIHGPDVRISLTAARPTGPWHEFGTLTVDLTAADDKALSFDPMLNEIPGLTNYRWVRRVREGAYRSARRSRVRAAG